MSDHRQSKNIRKCSHKDISIGPRGANCLSCLCFMHSQSGKYDSKSSIICTLNLNERESTSSIVPYEYYNTLISDENNAYECDLSKLSPQVIQIRK